MPEGILCSVGIDEAKIRTRRKDSNTLLVLFDMCVFANIFIFIKLNQIDYL